LRAQENTQESKVTRKNKKIFFDAAARTGRHDSSE